MGGGGHRLRTICRLIGTIGVLAFAPTARAVVIQQHPVPLPAQSVIGWSGGLLATGISTESGILATAITPAPFSIGKEYRGTDSASAIGLGPDGYPLIAAGGALYEITPTAATQEVRFGGSVSSIASGSGGAVWMAAGKTILRYLPNGDVASYPLPASVHAVTIAAGPDNAMWFTDMGLGTIGRINVDGEVSIFPIEDGDRQFGWGYMDPYGIAQGSDGALWFTEQNHERIGRVTTNGALQEFIIPHPKATVSSVYPQPRFIVSGPGNVMWFSDPGDSSIGRITMSGEVTEYPVLANGVATGPDEITLGPENIVWFTETNAKDLGSLDPNVTATVSKVGHQARQSGRRHRRRCPRGTSRRRCAVGGARHR